jgi:hypothetical protein
VQVAREPVERGAVLLDARWRLGEIELVEVRRERVGGERLQWRIGYLGVAGEPCREASPPRKRRWPAELPGAMSWVVTDKGAKSRFGRVLVRTPILGGVR